MPSITGTPGQQQGQQVNPLIAKLMQGGQAPVQAQAPGITGGTPSSFYSPRPPGQGPNQVGNAITGATQEITSAIRRAAEKKEHDKEKKFAKEVGLFGSQVSTGVQEMASIQSMLQVERETAVSRYLQSRKAQAIRDARAGKPYDHDATVAGIMETLNAVQSRVIGDPGTLADRTLDRAGVPSAVEAGTFKGSLSRAAERVAKSARGTSDMLSALMDSDPHVGEHGPLEHGPDGAELWHRFAGSSPEAMEFMPIAKTMADMAALGIEKGRQEEVAQLFKDVAAKTEIEVIALKSDIVSLKKNIGLATLGFDGEAVPEHGTYRLLTVLENKMEDASDVIGGRLDYAAIVRREENVDDSPWLPGGERDIDYAAVQREKDTVRNNIMVKLFEPLGMKEDIIDKIFNPDEVAKLEVKEEVALRHVARSAGLGILSQLELTVNSERFKRLEHDPVVYKAIMEDIAGELIDVGTRGVTRIKVKEAIKELTQQYADEMLDYRMKPGSSLPDPSAFRAGLDDSLQVLYDLTSDLTPELMRPSNAKAIGEHIDPNMVKFKTLNEGNIAEDGHIKSIKEAVNRQRARDAAPARYDMGPALPTVHQIQGQPPMADTELYSYPPEEVPDQGVATGAGAL